MIEINVMWFLYALYAYLGLSALWFCLLSLSSLAAGETYRFFEFLKWGFMWPRYLIALMFR